MVARFLYRLVSLFFFLASLTCWGIGLVGLYMQIVAAEFHLSLCAVSVWAFILAFMMMQASGDAWRTARYRHPHLWSHYP
jgi:hypothetical protein